jgi:hypothetical protein
MTGIRATVRATVGAPRPLVFDTLVPMDVTTLLRGYAFLPAVVAVDGGGAWDAVGTTRTLRLSDGNSLRERLTEHRRPHGVGYALDAITGPLGALVDGAEGAFAFEEEGPERTSIVWTYTYRPRSRLAAPAVRLVIGVFWRRYMARALARAVAEVERRAATLPV